MGTNSKAASLTKPRTQSTLSEQPTELMPLPPSSLSFKEAQDLVNHNEHISALQVYHKLGRRLSRRVVFANIYSILKDIDKKHNGKTGYARSFRELGPAEADLEKLVKDNVVVSLTSYPARISTVSQVIDSLLSQSLAAKVCLWLAREEFPGGLDSLPEDLTRLQSEDFEIEWCANIRSYKKIIPTLLKDQDKTVITADDDVVYDEDWLLQLITHHMASPQSIVCHRAHAIRTDSNGNIAPYSDWSKDIIGPGLPEHCIFPTGVGGILYPPKSLHNDVHDRDKFMDLCPHADDIWLWLMASLRGTKIIKIPDSVFTLNDVEGSQETALWKENVSKGGNDIAMKRIIQAYPEIISIQLSTAATCKEPIASTTPSVSVIMPIFNTNSFLLEAVHCIMNQTFKDIELIIVNDGSDSVETLKLLGHIELGYSRVRIIHQKNCGPASARNYGMAHARGEYIAFIDSDDCISETYLEGLHESISRSGSDIAICPRVFTFHGDIGPNTNLTPKNLGIDLSQAPNSFVSRIIVASGTSWNKMYRRSFLDSNSLTYLEGSRCFSEDNYFTALACVHALSSISLSSTGDYYYRQHPASLVARSSRGTDFENSIDVYKKILEAIDSSDSFDKQYWKNVIAERARKDLKSFAISNNISIEHGKLVEFSDQLTLCCIADHNYIVPVLVLLQSLKDSHKSNIVTIYLLVPAGSAKHMKAVEKLVSIKFSIIVKEICIEDLLSLHKRRTSDDFCMASPAAMIKFLIPEIFPEIDRILYIDSDIVVRSSLVGLYMKDFDNHYLCAATDMWEPVTDRRSTKRFQNYFNSGVMLMNLLLMRRLSISSALIEEKRSSSNNELMDQDAFNAVCGNRTIPIDISYNFQTVCFKRHKDKIPLSWLNKTYNSSYNSIDHAAENPAIVHWAGSDKPWKNLSTKFAKDWFNIFRLLERQNIITASMRSFVKHDGGACASEGD